jgi:hypothetical protein
MAIKRITLPGPNIAYVNRDGTPSQVFAQYMQVIDALLGALASNQVGNPIQLTQAVNDAAAAAAGVGIGQLYRNGSALLVRVV